MDLSQIFRAINILNPSTHGRNLVALMAWRLGALPPNGVYEVKPGIFMDLNMTDYIDKALYFDTYEIRCVRLVCQWLRPEAVFLDVGANIGFYSFLAKQCVGTMGRVIAFEPNPETVEKTQKNIRLNANLEIELQEVALSDEEHEVTLYSSSQTSHGEVSMSDQGWGDAREIRVPAARLDTVLPRDLSRVDCIKIDVEGAECLVFEGAQHTIRRYQPAILLEVNRRAARSFGHGALDATKMLLEYCPSYQICLVKTHSVMQVSLAQLEAWAITNANLWLYPPMPVR